MIEKLRYLLSKRPPSFGDLAIGGLTSQVIAAWRMALSPGYRFEQPRHSASPSPGRGVG
jgi:hypothetical protein